MRSVIKAWLAGFGLAVLGGRAGAARRRGAVYFGRLQLVSAGRCFIGRACQEAGIVALSYHVDYWDDGGWQDRFSIPEATQRQRGYIQRLSRAGAFTPQIVVSGDTSLVGSNRTGSGACRQRQSGFAAAVADQGRGTLYIHFLEAWREAMDVYLVRVSEGSDRQRRERRERTPHPETFQRGSLLQAVGYVEWAATAHGRVARGAAARC